MQRIADELKLSPGNLTYHFPKKEDLMLSIYKTFQLEMSSILPSSEQNKPNLLNIDEQIQSFYILQQRFLFFYLDLLEIERAYESIADQHYRHIEKQIDTIKIGLEYNADLGYLRKREDPNTYQLVAQQLWFTAVFWPKQIRVRGIQDHPNNMRVVLWHLINPHLTEEGNQQVKTILEPSNMEHKIYQL